MSLHWDAPEKRCSAIEVRIYEGIPHCRERPSKRSARVRIEVVIAKTPWVPVLALRIHQALPDHIFGYLIVIGPLLLSPFTFHTDNLMIVYGENSSIQSLMAPGALNSTENPLLPLLFHLTHLPIFQLQRRASLPQALQGTGREWFGNLLDWRESNTALCHRCKGFSQE